MQAQPKRLSLADSSEQMDNETVYDFKGCILHAMLHSFGQTCTYDCLQKPWQQKLDPQQ